MNDENGLFPEARAFFEKRLHTEALRQQFLAIYTQLEPRQMAAAREALKFMAGYVQDADLALFLGIYADEQRKLALAEFQALAAVEPDLHELATAEEDHAKLLNDLKRNQSN